MAVIVDLLQHQLAAIHAYKQKTVFGSFIGDGKTECIDIESLCPVDVRNRKLWYQRVEFHFRSSLYIKRPFR